MKVAELKLTRSQLRIVANALEMLTEPEQRWNYLTASIVAARCGCSRGLAARVLWRMRGIGILRMRVGSGNQPDTYRLHLYAWRRP